MKKNKKGNVQDIKKKLKGLRQQNTPVGPPVG